MQEVTPNQALKGAQELVDRHSGQREHPGQRFGGANMLIRGWAGRRG